MGSQRGGVYRVGSVVVHELVKNWERYEKQVPKK